MYEDNEPESIESYFGDMIINPKYKSTNELQNAEAKVRHYEEEYNKIIQNNIKENKLFKQQIFNLLKNNVNDDDDDEDDEDDDDDFEDLKLKINNMKKNIKSQKTIMLIPLGSLKLNVRL